MTLLPKRFELPNDISYAPLVRHIDLSTFLQDLPVEANKNDWSHATKSDNAPVEEFKVGDRVRLREDQKDGKRLSRSLLDRGLTVKKIEVDYLGDPTIYVKEYPSDACGWYTWRRRHA